MEMNVNVLPNGLAGQAPKGRMISKRAVMLYFAVIALLIAYMGYTVIRLNVNPNVQCGAYNASQVAHAEVTFAWAFTHPGANVSTYVSHVCAGLQQSYKIQLPS
jgi:hypothetical protein